MGLMHVAIVALLLFGTAGTASANQAADARTALRAGAHVALMRHADAPGGAGDPPGFRLENCATQRNLSPKGRADAEKIGSQLKQEGIVFEKIVSSPWCRCVDTARLLDLGAVETVPTFGNVVVLRDQREALTAGARALIAAWTGRGNLLVVTHGANIFALTGVSPASGEIVVVKGAAIAPRRLAACCSIRDQLRITARRPWQPYPGSGSSWR